MFSAEAIANIEKARESEQFTDYEIICEEKIICVHRVIICSQSPVFFAACTGKFKEARGKYVIRDFSPGLVREMITYLYQGTYDVDEIVESAQAHVETTSKLLLHAEMFALAEKYAIRGLQLLSVENYRKILREETSVHNYLLSIPKIYSSTPESVRALRDVVLQFARAKLPESLDSEEARETFSMVTTEAPDFTKDLLQSYMQNPVLGTCSTCTGKSVPLGILQCRCKSCGKGGATYYRPH